VLDYVFVKSINLVIAGSIIGFTKNGDLAYVLYKKATLLIKTQSMV